jgi:hypothetical protein
MVPSYGPTRRLESAFHVTATPVWRPWVRLRTASASSCRWTRTPPRSLDKDLLWISEFWLGMEFADLLGAREDQAQHRAALDAMQRLLERLDARAGKRAGKRAAADARRRPAAGRPARRRP